MGALGNALGGDVLREAFATPDFRRLIRPVIGVDTGSARDDQRAGTPGDDVPDTTAPPSSAASTGGSSGFLPTRDAARLRAAACGPWQ